jgi:hypothetical protein
MIARLMMRMPWIWLGRILYMPRLSRESKLAYRCAILTAGAANVWWIWSAPKAPLGFLVPILVVILGSLLYIRSWPIWDLLVWDSTQPWKTPPSEQDANYEASSEAWLGVSLRDPRAIRSALAKIVDPTPHQEMVALYYAALADLIEGRAPDPAPLTAQLDRLDPGPRHESARVMVALVAAGSLDISGGEWRAPLLAVRRQLGLRLSIRRALWPMGVPFIFTGFGLAIGLFVRVIG